jgi:hypothetical protein
MIVAKSKLRRVFWRVQAIFVQSPNKLKEVLYPYMAHQTTHSACGKVVVYEGLLVWMKEETVI